MTPLCRHSNGKGLTDSTRSTGNDSNTTLVAFSHLDTSHYIDSVTLGKGLSRITMYKASKG
jgi:hypothetical protein